MELKEIRKKVMMTQIEASKVLDISLRTYVRYENEKQYVGLIKRR